MGQATRQIEEHIESTREQLGSNLHELERKVKSVTDWRQHFESNPMLFIGAAVGGGILLSSMLGGRRRSRGNGRYAPATSVESNGSNGLNRDKALDAWQNIKGALIGVAATRFTNYVGEIVPGFQEHFECVKQKANSTA